MVHRGWHPRYHLWFIEAPISIARAVLKRESTLVPLDKPTADVMAVAKRNLRPGDRLDTFGGYTFYGLMDKVEETLELDALPLGLAPEAQMTNPVKAGQIITRKDVILDEHLIVNRLRDFQEGRKSKL